jgi:hypothetical protein
MQFFRLLTVQELLLRGTEGADGETHPGTKLVLIPTVVLCGLRQHSPIYNQPQYGVCCSGFPALVLGKKLQQLDKLLPRLASPSPSPLTVVRPTSASAATPRLFPGLLLPSKTTMQEGPSFPSLVRA